MHRAVGSFNMSAQSASFRQKEQLPGFVTHNGVLFFVAPPIHIPSGLSGHCVPKMGRHVSLSLVQPNASPAGAHLKCL